jgi:hypothetical protein
VVIGNLLPFSAHTPDPPHLPEIKIRSGNRGNLTGRDLVFVHRQIMIRCHHQLMIKNVVATIKIEIAVVGNVGERRTVGDACIGDRKAATGLEFITRLDLHGAGIAGLSIRIDDRENGKIRTMLINRPQPLASARTAAMKMRDPRSFNSSW